MGLFNFLFGGGDKQQEKQAPSTRRSNYYSHCPSCRREASNTPWDVYKCYSCSEVCCDPCVISPPYVGKCPKCGSSNLDRIGTLCK